MLMPWLIVFFLVASLYLTKTRMIAVPPKAFLLSAPEMPSTMRTLTQESTPPPDDPTMIYDDMNGATIQMKVGEKKKLLLPGNATTGYHWRIVRMEGNSVSSPTKWKYRLAYPFLMGSGGYFQKEFIAVETGTTEVYLIYDPVAEPQLGYYFYLRFDVY